MAQKRPHSPPPSHIYSSSPIYDRSSTFRAVYSPTLSARALQSLPSLATATHRIAAWRVPSKQTTIDAKLARSSGNTQLFDAGHDSDGERGAGRRLENLMVDEAIEGTVVVGRWFGGVMLGPVRFSHIDNVARAAIRSGRAETNATALKRARVMSPRPATPSRRFEEDAKRKLEIMAELKERDANIAELRQLLEDKRARLEGREPTSITPSRPVNYARIPLAALKALDKARDATVAYLLKELDKVDQAQVQEDELNAALLEEEQREEERQQEIQRQHKQEQDEQAWRALDSTRDQT